MWASRFVAIHHGRRRLKSLLVGYTTSSSSSSSSICGTAVPLSIAARSGCRHLSSGVTQSTDVFVSQTRAQGELRDSEKTKLRDIVSRSTQTTRSTNQWRASRLGTIITTTTTTMTRTTTTTKWNKRKCLSIQMNRWEPPKGNGVVHEGVDDIRNLSVTVIGNGKGVAPTFEQATTRENKTFCYSLVVVFFYPSFALDSGCCLLLSP